MTDLNRLAEVAWRIRRYAVRMGEVQGQGYVGQALGYARSEEHTSELQSH